MSEVSPELVERMVALVRTMAATHVSDVTRAVEKAYAEADYIAADLPKPVDPDLMDARKLVASMAHDGDWAGIWASNVCEGKHDQHESVVLALAAIKRGRELSSQVCA